MKNNQTTSLLKLTRVMFFVNALVWLMFGVGSLVRAFEEGSTLRWIITIMMIANAAVMFWFGMVIVNGQKRIFFLAFLYIALNVVLSITDQFGWVDALILSLNLILLGLLFVTRQRMKQIEKEASGDI